MSAHGTRYNCPFCNALYTKIIKTEMLTKNKKRIRECPRCGKTFETIESNAAKYNSKEPEKDPKK